MPVGYLLSAPHNPPTPPKHPPGVSYLVLTLHLPPPEGTHWISIHKSSLSQDEWASHISLYVKDLILKLGLLGDGGFVF